jgi:hypothetical protein
MIAVQFLLEDKMIEEATVIVGVDHMPTRLHEHGRNAGDRRGLYGGYLEGKNKKVLDKLAEQNELVFYQDGEEVAKLKGIVWGPVVEMYENHFIRHLEWEKNSIRKNWEEED